MPASARSLKITESYRTRMIGLRNRAKAEAKRTWSKVDPDRLDATFNPGMLVLMTAQLQREAARLSAGYLAAYVSSEKGERVPPPMAVGLDVGKVWTGSSLTKAFRGAVIGTKIQIGDGKEPIEAYKEGGQALVRTAGLAVDDVCRESLRVAMDQSPDVNGYVRAVKGTCEACLGAADGKPLEPGEVLDTHPNCQCVSEPVVGDSPLTQAEKDRLEGLSLDADLADPATRPYVRALLELDDDALRRLDDLGVEIELSGSKTLGEMPIGPRLAEYGRGMAGVSKGDVIAVSSRGKPETLLHEIGHFLDKAAGLRRAEFEGFRGSLQRSSMGMGHKWLMPGGSGNKEMWADLFRSYVKNGRQGVLDEIGRKMPPARAKECADWTVKEAERLMKGS